MSEDTPVLPVKVGIKQSQWTTVEVGDTVVDVPENNKFMKKKKQVYYDDDFNREDRQLARLARLEEKFQKRAQAEKVEQQAPTPVESEQKQVDPLEEAIKKSTSNNKFSALMDEEEDFEEPAVEEKKPEPKKEEKKPEPKKAEKKPEPKKAEKKPEPKKEEKKPEPKREEKKPEPKKQEKKPEPKKAAPKKADTKTTKVQPKKTAGKKRKSHTLDYVVIASIITLFVAYYIFQDKLPFGKK